MKSEFTRCTIGFSPQVTAFSCATKSDTYCHFTDGKRIGYCQYNRAEGYTVCTVSCSEHHYRNRISGYRHGRLDSGYAAQDRAGDRRA